MPEVYLFASIWAYHHVLKQRRQLLEHREIGGECKFLLLEEANIQCVGLERSKYAYQV